MQHDSTGREIATQVNAWNDAHSAILAAKESITALWRDNTYDQIVVTGCGSTHYLAKTAASLLQKSTGVLAQATPASELLLHPKTVYARGNPLLIAISRSGATSETIQAVEEFRNRYSGGVIVISCYDDKPLNALATVNLTARAGQEISVAQTRSFSAMLVMAEGLARLLDGTPYDPPQFSDAMQGWVAEVRDLVAQYADPGRFQRVFYLGSGPRYGLACEAMLKMKEMSLTSAEAFHTLEFRHGPMSMVDDETLIIGLLDGQDETEMAVIEEMKALGATTLTLSPLEGEAIDLPLKHYRDRPSLVHYLPFPQWLAYQRAVNKGLNPDAPRNLEQVVIL